MSQWFPPADYDTAPTTIDLRPGGTYRWGVTPKAGGDPFWSVGKFLEVDAPKRIVYTWRWSTAPDSEETIVTVEFHERGTGTELVLRHDRFPTKDMRDHHEQGWKHCFDQLEAFINKEKKR